MLIGIDIRRSGDFGVGTYIRNLVTALGRVGPEEEYVLIGRRGQFEDLGELGPRFRSRIYPRPYNAWQSHFDFDPQMRRLGLDILHVPHRWIPYRCTGPYVATLHDMDNILFPGQASAAKQFWRRHLLVHGLGRASRVMPVSEATKRDAVKLLGLREDLFEVVPAAADPRVAEPVTEQERERILSRYQIGDPFVLYAGRIQEHKNLPRLIEAFAVVKSELENDSRYGRLGLILIGDEITALPEVRHAVMRARIQPWVRFMGFVPLETLRVFYATASAFLFPSLYEGFGLPPLEAMAHGTPVVASNVSSLPEVLGDAAVLVNPQNVFDIARGLREVLVDDALREELRARGRRRTLSYSWDESARKVLEIYRQVTAPG
ncbi:MAG TPA: glycosyltransferase family 1 protein [Bryobacterales bacterium]|nr:glycosyltransferase family 1 protein [Bryobacterales bacterium]